MSLQIFTNIMMRTASPGVESPMSATHRMFRVRCRWTIEEMITNEKAYCAGLVCLCGIVSRPGRVGQSRWPSCPYLHKNRDDLDPANSTTGYSGNLSGGNDISWEDSAAERYYLADTTNVAGGGQVDVIDSEHGTFLYAIGGFVGHQSSSFIHNGPGGITVIHKDNELWAGDGNTTTKVVDLTTRSVVANVDVSDHGFGNTRADELAYDSHRHIIMITIPDATVPYVAFISQETRMVLGYLRFPAAVNGIEQPAWDRRTGLFYLNVPQIPTDTTGEIYVIDPVAMTVVNTFQSPCAGRGLVIEHENLVTSCGAIVNLFNGKLRAAVLGTDGNPLGGDEIWFDSGDDRVYFGSGNVAVVDPLIPKLLTYFVTPPGTLGRVHSIAADSENNHVFVPVTNIGVQVWASSENDDGQDHSERR